MRLLSKYNYINNLELKTINKLILMSILAMNCLTSFSQRKSPYKSIVDKLEVIDNQQLYKIKILKNDTIIEVFEAFLSPVNYKVPRYRVLGRILKKELKKDLITRHGISKHIEPNGDYYIAKYKNGQLLSVTYFDQDNSEISENHFYKIHNNLFDYGTKIVTEYLYSGEIKKRIK